jgi:CRISPR-associated endonuclease/helicase Cas3
MERAENKALRLQQIEKLLWAHPEGLSQSEVARRVGVNRSTIWKYIENNQLPPGVYVDEFDENKLKLDRSAELTKAAFSLHEIMALHLATRLLATRTDKQNPHAASALRKLAKALQRLDHNVSGHLLRSADVMDEATAYRDPVYLQVLETLTEAWSAGRKVKVTHLHSNQRIYEYNFAPYFIEPYAVGQTAHIIGWREPPHAIRTFKIERLRSAQILSDRYEIPMSFDPAALLRNAWGIWYSESEPIEVVLRFHPKRADRLLETRWQRDQQIEVQPDGWLLWRALIAEPQEMLPWIRGWGADVEVMAPDELREQQIVEASRLADLYHVTSKPPAHMLFWAKTGNNGSTHPLLCHLIDVGQVALALWENVLTDAFRNQIATALNIEPAAAGRLFAFWAACHDIGKASPNFQRKYRPAQPELEQAGFIFPPLMGKTTCYHATISALLLPHVLVEETDLDMETARQVAQALGGHHGSWPTADVRRLHKNQLGDQSWQPAQRALLRNLVDLFAPPAVTRLGRDEAERGAVLVLLSGLTSVADWIGSMGDYFTFSTPYVAAEVYAPLSARRALRALKALGWLDWQPPQEPLPFESLHGFTPHPAQQTVIDLLPGDEAPTLVIAEMLTGSGKTELALYLADRWAVLRGQRGLYVAMPTQATSNQMYDRVGKYLRKRYPAQQINYHLVHNGAHWRTETPMPEFATEDEDEHGTLKAQSWFLPRKRTLLAPFAVGTVDQALMSTLQTRHFFVRLFGLSGKTIIFDEVHAYDTYMNSLFTRLLVWLRAVGASVIVLSATLPAKTQQELVAAWCGTDEGIERLSDAKYPSVTVASPNDLYIKSLPGDDERCIAVAWIEPTIKSLLEELRDRLQNGGCVAVICNRVQRAQEVYCALREADLVADEDLLLFHARTPGVWRDGIEKAVISRFGKETGQRPHKSIVVATQVIEQSLDLDFDLMISDLAPIDLILQRAGRLHRHARPVRPAGLETPTLLIPKPEMMADGAPAFGDDAYIYAPYILLRSLWTLQKMGSTLQLPTQTEALIEAVYGDEGNLPDDLPANASDLLRAAQEKMTKHEDKARFEAANRLVPTPDYEHLLWRENDLLEEERPEIHASLQAMTRLMRPTINLVCLHGEPDACRLALDSGGLLQVDLTQKPTPNLTRELAQRVVTISHPAALRYFAAQTAPPGWREHTLLHTHRTAVFSNGICPLEGTAYLLRLSQRLGLEIIKLGEEQEHL